MSAPNLGPGVGGIMELQYTHPLLGPPYPIHLAVAPFDPTPSGPDGDYLYSGTGLYTPTETGILATYAAIAALWAPYYDPSFSIILTGVYGNTGGLPQPTLAVPFSAPVAGSGPALPTIGSRAKRSIYLFSILGARWRVWLRQVAVLGVGSTVDCYSNTGGIDARDQAWFGYFLAGGSGVVGRDGSPMQSAGQVRAWWDSPPAPYMVSG